MARVLIVGAGVLGSRVARLMKSHDLWILDRDIVEERNLRACKYLKSDIGVPKAIVLSSLVRGKAIVGDVLNARLPRVDLVLDCTDNLSARFAIERRVRVPWIHAAAEGNLGECMVCSHGSGFSAVFSSKKDSPGCSSTGIDSVTADAVAALQARLARKIISGKPTGVFYRVSGSSVLEIPVSFGKSRSLSFSESSSFRMCDSWLLSRDFDFKKLVSKYKNSASSFSEEHITIGKCTFLKYGKIVVREKDKKKVERLIRAILS